MMEGMKTFFAAAVLAGVILCGGFVEKELRHLHRIHEDFPPGLVSRASADHFSYYSPNDYSPKEPKVYANCLNKDAPCTTQLNAQDFANTGDFTNAGPQRVLLEEWDRIGHWRIWEESSGAYTGIYICRHAHSGYLVQGDSLSSVTTEIQSGYATCPTEGDPQ